MDTTSQDTGLALIRRIRSLPQKRQRALIELLRKQGVDLSALESIPRLPRTDGTPVPLSFTQQRLWFLAQLDGTSAAYNIPMAMRLRGRLDRPALLRALAAVVQRHEVLRTRFADDGGVPRQVIGDGRDFTVGEEELDDPARLAAICREEAAAPFDLERGPLIRARLLRQSEQEFHLLVTTHHSVSDGWSVGVFFRDLVTLYEAFCAGRPDPLEPLPVQYADYAHWQRERLAGELHGRQTDYWKRQLAGVDPRLTLPTDRERPRVKTYTGARENFTCPAELLNALRDVAKRHEATLYMTLLAAYTVALNRYTHQTDIAVGTVVAGRGRREVEDLVGFFANTLVMRADLADDPDFRDLLAQVKKTALEAYDHQDVPFEAVVEALDTERSLAHSPVFQTMFVLQEAQTRRDVTLGGLEVSPVDFELSFTKFDLTLDLRESPDGLVGSVEYNPDLYDRETVRRFIGHYTRLLAAVTDDPALPVSRLAMIDAEERRQVVEVSNDTERPFSDDRCLHELFEERVARHPGRTALVTTDRSWTYAELDAWAERVARGLRRHGVGPDTLVGLHAERSAEMVAGIMGALKAGGAYMPIEPSYPAARRTDLVDSSGVTVVLTQPHLDAEPLHGVEHLLVLHPDGTLRDEAGTDVSDASDSDVPMCGPGVGAGHLAYVIHTSGSTGRPKGVMIEHRAAVNRIEWMQNEYRLTDDDVVLQKTPYSFDVSVWEFFWPLLFGARLAIAAPGGHRDPAYLLSAVRAFGVTTLHFVPSMLRSIVEEPDWARCTTVRQVFCSGEALPPDLCVRHYEQHTAPLHNLYGPTEAAVDVSHWTVPADGTPRVVPIGRPIQNIQLHVLDEALAPQGVGCVGELYIAGAGLARGYLHQPELTRERFVPNPFGTSPDARMYRTGDLVRRLPDGDLEFLGRADDQVKMRGFRIEPGEIEHRLTEHPSVRSSAVLVREDQPGSPRLVAYVVPAPGHPLADHRADLIRHLEGALPEYMVPSAYVELATLPVTAHGKLDRRGLPAPGIDAFAQRDYVAPVTDTERQLAEVCAELLGFDAGGVSTEDNFFALGGHSLMITVLVARLKDSGLHITVQDVFTASTLADLAARIDATGSAPAHAVPANRIPEGCERLTPDLLPLIDLTQEQIDTVVAAVPGGAAAIQDVYPLLPTQEGILFHHLMDPDNDPYLVSTLYRADDEQACARFIDALQSVVDRHDVMRTAVLTAGLPEPVQVVHRAARIPVERTRLDAGRDFEEQARELLARQERMSLHSAPLLRLVVAEEPHSQRRYLLLTAHHLIEDATSLRLILHELAAHMAGRVDLLPTPAPYRDFVSHTLARHTADDTVAHFRAALEDVTEPTAPFGLTDVHGNGRRVGRLRRALPEPLARDLRAQAQRLQLSPACLFHAAWACFVAATSGRDDVVFGAVMSGRLQGVPGVERMLGNFINTLPLRTRLAGRTVRELVADVDTGLRELIAREQSPLSLVQRCSGLDGDAPLFSAVVNFRHFEAGHDEALPRIDDHGVRFLAAVDAINYPVTVSLDDFGTELSLDVQVEETVTCEAVADCLETALAGLLDALATDDGAATAALDVNVLPAGDRQRLAEWNDTATPLSHETLPAAFEAQVVRTPDRTALVFEGRTLSYAELNARANRLAHWLIERGAGPGQRIAIRMPRSFDLVVAVHAVVKTGAAYLPMETDLPDERVEQVLADSVPLLVLEELPDTTGGRDDNPRTWVGRDDAAYVLYTSGSTGRPKGVVIPHRAGLNWTAWKQSHYGMSGEDRMLLKTSVGFDVSVPELFWPLQVGAAVVIARPDGQKDPAYLARLIREERVTDLHFVPSMLAEFLSEPTAELCTGLRRVETAGEALPVELAERFARVLPDTELHNLYGPTEGGPITACRYRAEPAATAVPIGPPVWNTRVYVLDEALRQVPLGVPGELYASGDGTACGYLNRPDLTAERFVANPFDPGTRMYRTGDLVRWRAEGTLDYLGRVDDQVKVRGFRVEPGEVANVLLTHPSVHRAVVVPQGSGAARTLAAYVSPTPRWLHTAAPEENAAHLEQWRQDRDDRYALGTESADQDLVEAAARQLERIRPKRVLEIGCGAGELLLRYAGDCASVHALDPSATALDAARRGVTGRGWSHVTLAQGDALSLTELPGEKFDTIVLNSVVRNFPNEGYLEEALALLVPCLADGGSILVGDVRNLDLFTAQLCASERDRTEAGTTVDVNELAAQVRRGRRQERELLVSPTYFARLPERLPELGAVDLVVGRGGEGDEALAYRYDVILRKEVASAASLPWLEAASPAELRALLDGEVPDRFGVSGLTNPRVTAAVRLGAELGDGPRPRAAEPPEPRSRTADEVRELEAVLRHAEELGFHVAATWSQDRLDGLDLVFGRDGLPRVRARHPYRAPAATNHPQLGRRGPSLARALKEHLSAQLPHYMVPGVFVVLDELPVTPNGKVDKRALPAPDEADVTKEQYVAPRTEEQRALCRIVADVLGLTQVGLQDNFFDLGGHSLLATRLTLRIKKETGAELPLQLIFSGATIEEMAAVLEKPAERESGPPAPAGRTEADESGEPEPAPITLQQRDLWFLNRPAHLGTAHDNVQLAFRINGSLDRGAYARAVAGLVERHAVLRTSYVRRDGTVTQEVHPADGFAVRSAAVDEDAVTQWLRAERLRPFGPEDPYAIRAHLLTVSDDQHIGVLTRPWGVFDGWSVNVVLAELLQMYRAFSRKRTPRLPDLPLSYAGFARWQARTTDAAELSGQETYWRRQLAGLPACLPLRTDYERCPVKTYQGSSVDLHIPAELLERLRKLSQERGATLYMTLLSAFAVLLGGHTDGSELVVGTAVSNRPRGELERVVGYFVNLVALRLDVPADLSFPDVLTQARRVSTEAHEHKDLPFPDLVRALAPTPEPSCSPLFQVMFNLLPAADPGAAGDGTDLEVLPIRPVTTTTKYDLNLVAEETASGLRGYLEFSTDLFSPRTVEGMARTYERLLAEIVASPESDVVHLRAAAAATPDSPRTPR
ncbi:amino acid adenylation domain-containing protein [Streptomyces sp. b94]|uniref:non-ribosomal peptide synthetase n=1 Tax=Streptomyces sp. b94 TaxID=1827634 RepID=UPI001B370B02|nr:non-ribosomal peptide synthetase [Streptomyces sp. b94]MBQ1098888.1 amino acid adenylation domain-containing protein [Streptomyces sp. b94]